MTDGLTVRLAGTSCENCGQLLTPAVRRYGRTYVGSIAAEVSGQSVWLEGKSMTEHTPRRCRATRREQELFD